MNKKTIALNLGISILFAICIIVTALFLNGSTVEKSVMYLLLSGWLVPYFWLSKKIAESSE